MTEFDDFLKNRTMKEIKETVDKSVKIEKLLIVHEKRIHELEESLSGVHNDAQDERLDVLEEEIKLVNTIVASITIGSEENLKQIKIIEKAFNDLLSFVGFSYTEEDRKYLKLLKIKEGESK